MTRSPAVISSMRATETVTAERQRDTMRREMQYRWETEQLKANLCVQSWTRRRRRRRRPLHDGELHCVSPLTASPLQTNHTQSHSDGQDHVHNIQKKHWALRTYYIVQSYKKGNLTTLMLLAKMGPFQDLRSKWRYFTLHKTR